MSTLIKQVNQSDRHIFLKLVDKWYRYKSDPKVYAVINADSMGKYYNNEIKGNFDETIVEEPAGRTIYPDQAPADLIIFIFMNMKNLSPNKYQEYLQPIRDRLPKRDGLEFILIPSDHEDVKAVPVKCYLDGVINDTPDNIEELIDELKKYISALN